MPTILGIGILAGVALGFLTNALNPLDVSGSIRFLFLTSVGIFIVSLVTAIFYAVSVAWHEEGRYFLSKFFGPELPYFKANFRRAFLVVVLGLALFTLRRSGSFTLDFAGGATAIILIMETLFSAHDKHIEAVSDN